MKLPLSKGYTAVVDDDDPKEPWKFKWTAQVTPYTVYAYRFVWKNNKPKKLFLHRFIMGVTNPEVEVDHKDCNGLHCRRRNLRVASSFQNKCNQRKPVNNTSGKKGVYWDKSRSQWLASIQVHEVLIHLGRYDTFKEAKHARKLAEKRYFKDFTRD